MLEHHPNSPFTELRRILCCCFHDSILSRIGVSGKPGAVQFVFNWALVRILMIVNADSDEA